jgi:hypothetical protein
MKDISNTKEAAKIGSYYGATSGASAGFVLGAAVHVGEKGIMPLLNLFYSRWDIQFRSRQISFARSVFPFFVSGGIAGGVLGATVGAGLHKLMGKSK